MALDRPDTSPDRPEVQTTPDAPPGDPDPYNVASLTRAEAYESARTRASQLDGPSSGNYWTETSRLFAEWRDHVDRWPPSPTRDDQERSPGPESDYVNAAAEQVAVAEVSVSSEVKRVAEDCAQPAWLGGFEFRLKGADRIKEKVAEKLEAEPDRSPSEVIQAIPDAIRYTFCFDTGNYTSGFADIKDRLNASGYEMYYAKNFWSNSEYKGINSRWITPDGQRFEVQFHTAESFHAKHELTHAAYERIRDPRTSEHERSELREFQCEVSRWIPVPIGACDIPDY